ncbi:MAG: DUF4783 domain-containing protein [Bacteroidota bacterium]
MTFIYSSIVAILLSFSMQVDVPYSALEKAFTSNNASGITTSGKDKLMMNVLGKEGAYSKMQAEQVLKDFFSKKPDGQFQFIFKGKVNAEGTFAIGNYEYKGETYRVTIHFKKEGSDYKIESLNIEKS